MLLSARRTRTMRACTLSASVRRTSSEWHHPPDVITRLTISRGSPPSGPGAPVRFPRFACVVGLTVFLPGLTPAQANSLGWHLSWTAR